MSMLFIKLLMPLNYHIIGDNGSMIGKECLILNKAKSIIQTGRCGFT